MTGQIERKIIGRIEGTNHSSSLEDSEKLKIADELKIPLSVVESVSSFYFRERGTGTICTGLPCYLRRSGEDGHGNLESSSCLGYCDHAPVLEKDGKYYNAGDAGLSEIDESKDSFVMDRRVGIEPYMMGGGYTALEELIGSDDDSYVLRRLEASGLKGMGGAGYPAHLKWKSFRESHSGSTYLLVNAHEGEPGTFKDRKILEQNPHAVVEGALITAFHNGAGKIFVALKWEYANAYRSLMKALDELQVKFGEGSVAGMLPEIDVVRIGGTYVTGEETALMEALEDRRSEPRLRPPFPTEKGLFGRPTLVHNVETLSLIPEILRNSNALKKTYCLTGDVNAPGAIVADLGISARELVEGHGKSDLHRIRAFMPGGLSGGYLPPSQIGVKLDSESVRKTGASMGTGAVIVLSGDRCMVNIALSVSRFFEAESCGKCAPCRLGTSEISELLSRVLEGDGSEEDLEDGKQIARSMIDGSICALGQAAGKMFLDSIRYFEQDYREHLAGGCPTGECSIGGDMG